MSEYSRTQACNLSEAVAMYNEAGTAAMADADLMRIILGAEDSDMSGIMEAFNIGNSTGLPESLRIKMDAMLEFFSRFKRKVTITNPNDLYRVVQHYAFGAYQERMIVVALNGAHEVMDSFISTQGILNRTIMHPREVFARVLEKRAAAIAIAHNHPSGNVNPSEDDKDVTRRIMKCGEILGIKVLDHLVFSETGYFSFLEHGLM